MSAETQTVSSTAKQRVEYLLKQLPDNCTLQDVQEGLLLIQRLAERTEKAADPANWMTQEEAEQRMAKWLIK